MNKLLRYEVGSVLNVTENTARSHLWVNIEDRDQGIPATQVPILGWATVVIDITPRGVLTTVQPMFLYNGVVCTSHDVGATHVRVVTVLEVRP